MDAAQIAAIIARQMPDAAKRRRADFVVRTGLSRHHAQRAIRRLIRRLTQAAATAGPRHLRQPAR